VQEDRQTRKTPAPGAWNGGLDRAFVRFATEPRAKGNRGEIPGLNCAVDS